MKYASCIFLFLICLLFSNCNSGTVIINGNIIGDLQDELVYYPPIEGRAHQLFKETIEPDANGKFQLRLDIKETSPVLISLLGKNGKSVIVEPGKEYTCSIELKEKGFDMIFSGANEEGNKLFANRPIYVQKDPLRRTLFSQNNQFGPDEIIAEVQKQKDAELQTYIQLEKRKEISSSFMKTVELELTCYYAYLQAEALFTKYYMSLRTDKDSALPFKNAFEATYNEYPPSDLKLTKASSWFTYANDFISFRVIIDDNQQKMQEMQQQDLLNTYRLELADTYYPKEIREYYQASYLYFTEGFGGMEKELVKLFEEFKSEYPKSVYTPYLQPLMDGIIAFYEVKDKPYTSSINLIDNMGNINTLKEAVVPYKGKRLYIDVWATWCGPCKKEFQYNEGLKKLLKEKDIQMLYISIDKQSDKGKWEDMIKYYNLEGDHILANEELVADLRRLYDKNGMIAIPWYILIDEQGEIKELHFKGSSKLEELKESL